MKFIWPILLYLFGTQCFACESYLQAYKDDCLMADQFQSLKEDYDHYKVDPIKLRLTILPLIYGEAAFNSNKYSIIIDLQKNQNPFINSFISTFSLIKNLNQSNLTSDHIASIHKSISTNSPGKFRSFFGITKPKELFTCNTNFIDQNQLNFLKNSDLLDDENMPLVEIESSKACVEANRYQVEVSFVKGAKVKSELDRWLIDFNDALNRYEQQLPMNQNPNEYIIHMSRWFMAIHPFADRNEEVAYFLAYYATNRLKLSPLYIDPKTKFYLLSGKDTNQVIINSTKEKFKNYQNCLFEILDTHLSEECVSIK